MDTQQLTQRVNGELIIILHRHRQLLSCIAVILSLVKWGTVHCGVVSRKNRTCDRHCGVSEDTAVYSVYIYILARNGGQ